MLTLSLFDKGDGDDLLHRDSGSPLFEQYPQDGVQGMQWYLTQHTEHFKLKDFEKTAEAIRSLWLFPNLLP